MVKTKPKTHNSAEKSIEQIKTGLAFVLNFIPIESKNPDSNILSDKTRIDLKAPHITETSENEKKKFHLILERKGKLYYKPDVEVTEVDIQLLNGLNLPDVNAYLVSNEEFNNNFTVSDEFDRYFIFSTVVLSQTLAFCMKTILDFLDFSDWTNTNKLIVMPIFGAILQFVWHTKGQMIQFKRQYGREPNRIEKSKIYTNSAIMAAATCMSLLGWSMAAYMLTVGAPLLGVAAIAGLFEVLGYVVLPAVIRKFSTNTENKTVSAKELIKAVVQTFLIGACLFLMLGDKNRERTAVKTVLGVFARLLAAMVEIGITVKILTLTTCNTQDIKQKLKNNDNYRNVMTLSGHTQKNDNILDVSSRLC